MSWVKRGNNTYYYRSVRRGRRVTSVYFGDGPDALLVAEIDAAAAAERAARTAAHAENRRLSDSVENSASAVAELVTALLDACLLLSGHHRDHNLKWRRIRERKPMTTEEKEASDAEAGAAQAAIAPAGPAKAGPARAGAALSRRKSAGMISTAQAANEALRSGIPPADLTRFVELVQRVDHGRPDPTDLLDLEWALAQHPGIWRVIADYGRNAINAMIEQLQASPAVRLAFTRGAEELRAGLAGAGASPLEATIAEQIAVCWVRLRIYEFWLAKATSQEDGTLIRFWDERVSNAQRRYLAACHELAAIRQLAVRTPQLWQINIGDSRSKIED